MDKNNKGNVVLIDASNLGETIKEGKNQKTVLSVKEEQQIIDTFNNKVVLEDFSVVVSYEDIKQKNYSLSAGQYFEIKIEYTDITSAEFDEKMKSYSENFEALFSESHQLENEIKKQLSSLNFNVQKANG